MKLNLKEIRREAKMTQKVLASRVGITREYLSAIENNSKLPSLALLKRLAIALERDITELFSNRTATRRGNNVKEGKG